MFSLFFSIAWEVILPIFLLISLGGLLGRKFKLDLDTLTKVNLYAFVPCLMFIKYLESDLRLGQVGNILAFWMLFLGGMWFLGWLASPRDQGSKKLGPLLQMTAMFPNSGNFGIPVAQLAFGGFGAAVQAVVLILQNLFFFTWGAFLAAGGASSWRKALHQVLRLPAVYSALLAFALKGREYLLPPPVHTAMDFLGQGLIPVALITLGAQLAAQKRAKPRGSEALAVGLRLLAGPLVGFLVAQALGLDPHLAAVLILATCGPTAVNTVLLCMEFKNQPKFASNVVFWSTVLCPLTVTAVIGILRGTS